MNMSGLDVRSWDGAASCPHPPCLLLTTEWWNICLWTKRISSTLLRQKSQQRAYFQTLRVLKSELQDLESFWKASMEYGQLTSIRLKQPLAWHRNRGACPIPQILNPQTHISHRKEWTIPLRQSKKLQWAKKISSWNQPLQRQGQAITVQKHEGISL